MRCDARRPTGGDANQVRDERRGGRAAAAAAAAPMGNSALAQHSSCAALSGGERPSEPAAALGRFVAGRSAALTGAARPGRPLRLLCVHGYGSNNDITGGASSALSFYLSFYISFYLSFFICLFIHSGIYLFIDATTTSYHHRITGAPLPSAPAALLCDEAAKSTQLSSCRCLRAAQRCRPAT
eukprot:SAG31_NODE_569_length_14020_cov_11.049565_12_plen_183_part_00